MDGLDLAREVHDRWPHVMLLVTSARSSYANKDLPDHWRLIDKPYSAEVFLAEVRRLFAEHQAEGRGTGSIDDRPASRHLRCMKPHRRTVSDRTPPASSQSGLYVFSDGPSGPTKVSMKAARDVTPFAERLIEASRRNVRVGADEASAIPYAEWRLTNGPRLAER